MKLYVLAAILAFSASTLFWVSPSCAGLVIGGWDATRNGTYGINGSGSTQLVADINAAFHGATITSTGTLNSAYLSTINVLVIGDASGGSSATTALSAAEQTALLNFVKSGGSAIISVDNDTFQSGVSAINNSYVSPFDLQVTGTLSATQLATATTTVGPIVNGPFGIVSTLDSNFPGYFDSLGGSATSLADLNVNGSRYSRRSLRVRSARAVVVFSWHRIRS
jgi:hypothetical protein